MSWLTRDAALVIGARGLRSFGQGLLAVLISIYLHLTGVDTPGIGLFLSLGLAGAGAYTILVVVVGDALGRRNLLLLLSLLMAAAAVVIALTQSFAALASAAFVGGLNVAGGAGGGAMQPLEHAALAGSVEARRRTELYALYGMVGTGAGALGALCAAFPAFFSDRFGMSQLDGFRATFVVVAVVLGSAAAIYPFVTSGIERGGSARWVNPLKLPSRRTIFTLSALFSVDNFAGGLVAQSLVSLWFFTKFNVDLKGVGVIFFGSNLLAAVSLWVAARLARRIGLINTMVFTHIPSSLLLIAIPFLPWAWLAVVFWLVRGFFGTMDVPTRESYTMAVVGPNERTSMSGINSVARSVIGSASPSIAAALWGAGIIFLPFVACGVIKIGYDLALFSLFRRVKPPEEASAAAVPVVRPAAS